MDFWLAALLADIAITIILLWWGWSQKRQARIETERATELKQEVHEAELKIVELEMSATSDTVEAAMESMMQEAALQKQMIHDLRTDNGILAEELNCMTAEMRKQKGRAASAHTQRGQLLEKWTPFHHHNLSPLQIFLLVFIPVEYHIINWLPQETPIFVVPLLVNIRVI